MTQLDLQIDGKPRRARQGRQADYPLVQQPRPHGVIGQFSALLLQPVFFFRTLPALESSRQWLIFAVLLLIVTGAMAVRQAELSMTPTDNAISGMDLSAGMIDPGMSSGGGISSDFGGIPPDMGLPVPGDLSGTGGGTATSDVSTTWTTALVAAGGLIGVWLLQALLLSEVTLFNGHAPRLGLNLKIAVYASAPLALMTGLQALYMTAGGVLGAPGLTGLITEWQGFGTQTPFVQALLISLTSRFTLFWLWSLLLLYLGARHALRGRWWASMLVVLAWVTIVSVLPVVTGAITAPPTEEAIISEGLPEDRSFEDVPMDGDMGMMPDAENAIIDDDIPLLNESGSIESMGGGEVAEQPRNEDAATAPDETIESVPAS